MPVASPRRCQRACASRVESQPWPPAPLAPVNLPAHWR
jgi:hypothetical protein